MGIEARIIADSVNPDGQRLTTFVVKAHRFILAEINTHRQLSRSASSSRAIPVKKIIEQVMKDPAPPVYWGSEQRGMQSGGELPRQLLDAAYGDWLRARDRAVESAEHLINLGVHKSIVNRILEPFMWYHGIISATRWENFFTLRTHSAAQPEFRALALLMAEKFRMSEPIERDWGEWHLPFVNDGERSVFSAKELVKFSTARSARVSYMNHDGTEPVPAKDVDLHDKLLVDRHVSPAEMPAVAFKNRCFTKDGIGVSINGINSIFDFGNFGSGWLQYRKMNIEECAVEFPWNEAIV